MHRLRLPASVRRTLSSTNLIESTFSTVETVCRNVKRWQGQSRWNRVHGYRELAILVKELELAVVKALPRRHAGVA